MEKEDIKIYRYVCLSVSIYVCVWGREIRERERSVTT